LGQQCADDNECNIQYVCSVTAQKCVRGYIRELGKPAQDGRECITGAINEAGVCAETVSITQNGYNLEDSPYRCEPDTEFPCEKRDKGGSLITYHGATHYPD